MNFEQMTKVQHAVIPLFMNNKDVCVRSCTGSGKTLAFVVPLVQVLSKVTEDVAKDEVLALVLAPSRELAIQIYKVLQNFQEFLPKFNFCYLSGGSKIDFDLQRIEEKGCNVVVGTIGRIFDLYKKDILNFKKLEVFIMDEADKMLEDGHENQLNHILQVLPRQRRSGLFSATMTS